MLRGAAGGEFVYFENTADPVANTLTTQINGSEGWRMLTAPGAGATLDDLLDEFHTQGFPGADAGGGQPNVVFYTESVLGDKTAGYVAPTSQGVAIGQGQGVFAYVFEDDERGVPGVQGGFPKPLAVTGATPLNTFGWGADGPGPLSYTDDPGSPPEDDGWNMLGNPFSSWFDWDAVDLDGVNAPVYVWDDAVAMYRSYSAGVGALSGGIVAPFQGFWVQANAPNPGLTATRTAANGTAPLLKDGDRLTVALRLAPEASGGAPGALPARLRSEAHIALGTPGTEAGADRFDALALAPPAAAYVQVATLAASGGDAVALGVDHRPAADGTAEVPVTVKAVGGGGGPVRLVLTWDALPEGATALLRDHETGTEIDLATATEYAFEHAASAAPEAEGSAQGGVPTLAAPAAKRVSAGAARFSLVVGRGASTGNEPGAGLPRRPRPSNPTRDGAALRLSVPSPQRVRAAVYDALGREVAVAFDGEVASAAEIAVDTSRLASGVYVVRVTGEAFAEARRLTVAR